MNNASFVGQMQVWPVNRNVRTLRLYVVEPTIYQPTTHEEIFNGIITGFFTQQQALVDPYLLEAPIAPPEPFDLITFPEAFLPANTLVAALDLFAAGSDTGCVHVGLRPSEESNHLFCKADVEAVLVKLKGIDNVEKSDLKVFESWLKGQNPEWRFNIGCLFAVDNDGKVRICLHPKMVRSKIEKTPLQESYMTEANVLSLVTLVPADKRYLSITLQPLLCSDALFQDTDIPFQRPFEGVNDPQKGFGKRILPDHVDIVSLAMCTSQPEQQPAKGTRYRQWHQKFRDAFTRVAGDEAFARHLHAMFLMSNFNWISSGDPGGLSGAFLPLQPREMNLPPYVQISSYGRHIDGMSDNTWSTPEHGSGTKKGLRGHLAMLSPDFADKQVLAVVFGFTLSRPPSHVSSWTSPAELSKFDCRELKKDPFGKCLLGAHK